MTSGKARDTQMEVTGGVDTMVEIEWSCFILFILMDGALGAGIAMWAAHPLH